MRTPRDTRGFTLIELMIVVVIIGILAALAIPRFGNASARAKEKEADGILKQIYTLQQVYQAQNGAFAAALGSPGLTDVGWEDPQGLQHYELPVLAADGGASMAKSGTGYCDRAIDAVGDITSLNCN